MTRAWLSSGREVRWLSIRKQRNKIAQERLRVRAGKILSQYRAVAATAANNKRQTGVSLFPTLSAMMHRGQNCFTRVWVIRIEYYAFVEHGSRLAMLVTRTCPRDNSASMQIKNRMTKIGDYGCCAIAHLMISTYTPETHGYPAVSSIVKYHVAIFTLPNRFRSSAERLLFIY